MDRFSDDPALIGTSCKSCDEIENKSDKYYVIIVDPRDEFVQWNRRSLKRCGFVENDDYCFCILSKYINADINSPNKKLADKLYIPDKYKKSWYDTLSTDFFSNNKLHSDEIANGIVVPIRRVGNPFDLGAVKAFCEKHNL